MAKYFVSLTANFNIELKADSIYEAQKKAMDDFKENACFGWDSDDVTWNEVGIIDVEEI